MDSASKVKCSPLEAADSTTSSSELNQPFGGDLIGEGGQANSSLTPISQNKEINYQVVNHWKSSKRGYSASLDDDTYEDAFEYMEEAVNASTRDDGAGGVGSQQGAVSQSDNSSDSGTALTESVTVETVYSEDSSGKSFPIAQKSASNPNKRNALSSPASKRSKN